MSTTLNQTETDPLTAQVSVATQSAAHDQPLRTLRVYMMEMWSFIPYYVGRLCASLRSESVEATLGSVRYHLDRDYFQKVGLDTDRHLFDVGGRFRAAPLRRLFKSCEYVANLIRLGLRLRASNVDILHVQFLPFLERGVPIEIWFLKWLRRRGIRIVYTVHNVTRQDAPNQGRSLFRRAYNLADALICHGEGARTELARDFCVPPEKIRVIPHGPLFEDKPGISTLEARSLLGLPPGKTLVLSLGVISQYKGIPFLLDAWKRVQQSATPGRLIIAGTGDAGVMKQIREKVEAEGLKDSVDLWLRFIPVEQLPLLYQAADILVYPYNAGTTSGALLTGLNYGKAIVATRLPFFQEYLEDGESGLLVDYGDISALASSLQALIHRPALRSKIASTLQRESSGTTCWEEIARKTRECYDAVLR